MLTLGLQRAFAIMVDAHPKEADSLFVNQLTEHQLALQFYVRSLLPGDPSAGDVTQQANAKIWEKRHDFEPGTNFKAWAFSIARHEVLNYRKQQARDARLVFSDELEQVFAAELSDQQDDFQGRHEALRECLGKLRPRDRALLLHRYRNRGSLAEYAGAVGRSLGGLKVTLHRLRSVLLSCMQRTLKAGEATV